MVRANARSTSGHRATTSPVIGPVRAGCTSNASCIALVQAEGTNATQLGYKGQAGYRIIQQRGRCTRLGRCPGRQGPNGCCWGKGEGSGSWGWVKLLQCGYRVRLGSTGAGAGAHLGNPKVAGQSVCWGGYNKGKWHLQSYPGQCAVGCVAQRCVWLHPNK